MRLSLSNKQRSSSSKKGFGKWLSFRGSKKSVKASSETKDKLQTEHHEFDPTEMPYSSDSDDSNNKNPSVRASSQGGDSSISLSPAQGTKATEVSCLLRNVKKNLGDMVSYRLIP
jgi:hypothetical protein